MATSPPTATYSQLETLPILVLDQLCEYLADCDYKRPSLFTFSLAMWNRNQLRQKLKRWNEILEIDRRFAHVCRVKIVGNIPLVEVHEQDNDVEVATYFDPEWLEKYTIKTDDDCFSKPSKLPTEFLRESPLLPSEEKQSQSTAWMPLAQFIERCSSLENFVHDCFDQVTTCILEALHQRHPNCRLHVYKFGLRSLYQWQDNPQDIDPDEYALATSPFLNSINSLFSGYGTDGKVEYNAEAVRHMAAAAPKLKSVRTAFRHAGDHSGDSPQQNNLTGVERIE
ncbi:hypothetical protein AJ80_07858 [Polytolypa hystricis UAMH7299]|uniref:F-box domain-containing protein n=1 Tax=Polytolypa hystricis (strain UAMH7299) TaxID=1447883 RepID=A0A2B7XHS4_POLH7|nr:hypothetical protein AJ80_07858 [Polytolypa hystricis UAMH7299]